MWLVDSLVVPASLHDVEGRFVHMNAAAERASGSSNAQLLGRHFTEPLPPEAREAVEAHFRRAVEHGEPTGTYHWETEQEDFLVLAGEGVLIVEGEERPLKQWDFVHCPPGTKHAFAGAGEGPCVILCASSRQFQKDGPWGYYCVDETAAKYNASSPEETQDGSVAYARFEPAQETRYPGGLLPGD